MYGVYIVADMNKVILYYMDVKWGSDSYNII